MRSALFSALTVCAALSGCDCGTSPCKGVTCTALDGCHLAGACDAKTGKGSNPVKALTCNAPGPCRVGAGAACPPATGDCAYPTAPEGTWCDDGTLCNGHEVCKAETCAAGTAVSCNSPPACHVGGTCDPSSGSCSYANA